MSSTAPRSEEHAEHDDDDGPGLSGTRRTRLHRPKLSGKVLSLIAASTAVVSIAILLLAIAKRSARKRMSSAGEKSGHPTGDEEATPRLMEGAARFVWDIRRNVATELFARTAPIGQQQQQRQQSPTVPAEVKSGPFFLDAPATESLPLNFWIVMIYRETCSACKQMAPVFKREARALYERNLPQREAQVRRQRVVVGAIEESQLPLDFPIEYFPTYLVMNPVDNTKFTMMLLDASQLAALFATADVLSS